MSAPSSQAICVWIKRELITEDWVRLRDVCEKAIKRNIAGISESSVSMMVDDHVSYIAENFRNEVAACREDGVPPELEVDEEESPYVRLVEVSLRSLLEKLRSMDPFDFEKLCAHILNQIGAMRADVTNRSNDGGVDFYAIDFDFVPDGILTPQSCRATVIGQAKRYKEGNQIKETEVRAFIGGAIKVKNDLAMANRISALSPVVYAFWTTSDFERNAKIFAKEMGVWFLGGRTMAKYVQMLGLEPYVDELLQPKAA